MNTKKQIVTLHLVRSIMILLMMGWTGGAWAQNGTVAEKVIYTTDFTDWTEEIQQGNRIWRYVFLYPEWCWYLS